MAVNKGRKIEDDHEIDVLDCDWLVAITRVMARLTYNQRPGRFATRHLLPDAQYSRSCGTVAGKVEA